MDVKELSLEEKLKLVMGKNAWQTEDLDGKIPPVVVADGPVGLRKTVTTDWDGNTFKTKTLPAVAYPSFEVLSQTWNPALAYAMGECLADDCIDIDVDVLLGPGVNIKRSPICGRSFEYFSEDPFVAGVFGKAYIEGLQSKHVGATLKHYVANNNEVGRNWASSNVDERTLREIYMRPFEISLEAKPWAVMSSYNLLNGVRVVQSKECTDILRAELGHGDKLLMSDWWSIKDSTQAIKAGTDLEMPFDEAHKNKVKKDFAEGKITETEIDACAQRVLDFVEKNAKERALRKCTYSVEERREVAQKIEEEGAVLLKNNGVLPIKNGQSVAFSAQIMDRYYVGGGSAKVVPEKKVEPLVDCLKAALPDSPFKSAQMWSNDYVQSFKNADGADVSVVMVGYEMGEGNDRKYLTLKNWDNEDWFIKAVAKRNPNTVVVMFGGGVVDVSEWIDDVAAVIHAGYAGEMGGEALANILTGKTCPSGKLTETFANTQKDYPSENIFFDGFDYNYDEGMDVGYRYFDKHPEKVRFPFGFGLSYTKFEYADMDIEKDGEKLYVSFSLKNVGAVEGAEISQIYVRAKNGKVEKPLQELRGFAKTLLKVGEQKRVRILLDDRAFYHYAVEKKAWVKDSGVYEIAVSEHAQSALLTKTVEI